jgi:hypothetical protein
MTTPAAQVELTPDTDPLVELSGGVDLAVNLSLTEDALGELILLEAQTPELALLEGGLEELIALEAPGAQIAIGPILSAATPQPLDSTGAAGSSGAAARADHIHPHGNLSGGLLHTLATTEAAGFLSPNDKQRLLELASGSDQQLLIADSSSLETFRYGKLFDINVASDAAIAGTKINPNFGTQNLATTGSLSASNAVISGNLTVNGTLTTVNTENIQVTDKTIVLSNITPAADATANEGGIILKGATDKTILWLNSSGSWTFNQSVDLASGKTFNINNQTVLSATTLGSSVTASSLTSVGTITSGSWDEGIY